MMAPTEDAAPDAGPEPTEGPQPGGDPHLSRAMSALSSGRLEEAIHLLRCALPASGKASPEGELARQTLLKSMSQGEEGLTLAIIRQAGNFEIRAQRAVLRLARAVVLSLTGRSAAADCKGAFEDAGRAVELREADPRARIHRANVLLFSARCARDTGKDVREVLELARADLDAVLSAEDTHAVGLHNRGIVHFYLATIDRKEGRDPADHFTNAIRDLRSALRVSPSYGYLLKDLGVCQVALARAELERGGRPHDLLHSAVRDLSRAIDLEPALYGAYHERAMASFSLKRFDQALVDWRECLRLDPSRSAQVDPLIGEAQKRKDRARLEPPPPGDGGP